MEKADAYGELLLMQISLKRDRPKKRDESIGQLLFWSNFFTSRQPGHHLEPSEAIGSYSEQMGRARLPVGASEKRNSSRALDSISKFLLCKQN